MSCLGLVEDVALSASVAQGSNSGVALQSTKSQHSFRDVLYRNSGRPPKQWTKYIVLIRR